MDVRAYRAGDQKACLAVFDSNLPESFDAAERTEFERFISHLPGPYFVMDHDGDIVGCGGYEGTRLRWGMIRHDVQRKGLGRFLLMYRLREMTRAMPGLEAVLVETGERAAAFFESQGFRVVGTSAEGLVEMKKRLTVCA